MIEAPFEVGRFTDTSARPRIWICSPDGCAGRLYAPNPLREFPLDAAHFFEGRRSNVSAAGGADDHIVGLGGDDELHGDHLVAGNPFSNGTLDSCDGGSGTDAFHNCENTRNRVTRQARARPAFGEPIRRLALRPQRIALRMLD